MLMSPGVVTNPEKASRHPWLDPVYSSLAMTTDFAKIRLDIRH